VLLTDGHLEHRRLFGDVGDVERRTVFGDRR
jgi:hypothetical protein